MRIEPHRVRLPAGARKKFEDCRFCRSKNMFEGSSNSSVERKIENDEIFMIFVNFDE